MSDTSICLVAGEPSGDLHGSLLVREIKTRHPDWRLWGVGSSKMAAAGCELWRDAHDWAVMGFSEVIRSLRMFRRRLSDLAGEIIARRPSGVILIDYPGFNLKLAPRIRAAGIPVMYYIVPQLWAWGKGRIKIFQRYINRTVVVFPFEAEFFESHGVAVDWIGHPLADVVAPSAPRETLRRNFGLADADKLVALMPGVRPQDFRTHLPLFTGALHRIAGAVSHVRGCIGVSPTMGEIPATLTSGPVPLSQTSDVYDLLAAADVVLTKTGTTTVECALIGTPMVTVYRTGRLNYAIARALVDVPFIAMPNLIANRRVVPELVQSAAGMDAIAGETISLLTNDAAATAQRTALAEVKEKLGPAGAVARGADVVEDWLGQ